jgi:hypothetical protein
LCSYYWASFDYLYLNISKLMLTAVIDMKQQNKETEMSEDTSRKVQAIMDEVDDPQQLCELARHIEKRDESEIVIRLGEKCQRNIKEVEDLRLVRAPLTRELLELEAEQQKLVTTNHPHSLLQSVIMSTTNNTTRTTRHTTHAHTLYRPRTRSTCRRRSRRG